jgi:hypothetical protein
VVNQTDLRSLSLLVLLIVSTIRGALAVSHVAWWWACAIFWLRTRKNAGRHGGSLVRMGMKVSVLDMWIPECATLLSEATFFLFAFSLAFSRHGVVLARLKILRG